MSRRGMLILAGGAAIVAVVWAGGLAGRPAAGQEASRGMRVYQTPYYVLHTDLDEAMVREATVRLTTMAEEYYARTKHFSGAIRHRLPVYIFSRLEDYHAAGGSRGSGGLYNGRMLMAVAPAGQEERTWHVLQHEGFHQFAHMMIRGSMPIWVNEGMAEYFGQGEWTGDSLVTGLVPRARLARVKGHINSGRILPLLTMMMMSHEEWNNQLSGRNYDQAWSMIHFLVHAEEGRYRPNLEAFLRDLSVNRPWQQAFIAHFGRDVGAFEQKYRQWWLAQDDEGSRELYVSTTVRTLTNYFARCWLAGQKFAEAGEFLQAAADGKLKCYEAQWLPPALAARLASGAAELGEWSVQTGAHLPRLVLTTPAKEVYSGSFQMAAQKISVVHVTVTRPPAPAGGAVAAPR